jgi:hypothetical protein
MRFVDPSGLSFWGDFFAGLVGVLIVATMAVLAVWATIATFGLGGLALLGVGALLGAAIRSIQTPGSWEAVLAGALIGFSAAATSMAGGAAYAWLLGGKIVAGNIISGAFGGLIFLGTIREISHSDVYKGILGWTSWFNPVAWPGLAFGFGAFLINLSLSYFGGDLGIETIGIDWKTGMVYTVGGPIAESAPGNSDAHTIGQFAFYKRSNWLSQDEAQRSRVLSHEAGHMLSNALFSPIQLVNVIQPSSEHDLHFFERIAESNVPGGPDKGSYPEGIIPIWGDFPGWFV